MKHIICIFFFVLIGKSVNAQSVNFTSSNLPIVKINTNNQSIVDEPKIMADMAIAYNGVGVRNYLTDLPNHYNGKIGIELRGQSSQQFPMKSYGIELWNNDSTSLNKSLLGMPSESDWVLYAPYTDKTLMRNVLAYQISRELGNWASNCRYVEVLLNGNYKGIYVLMEKIKRKATRVNIASLNSTDILYPAISGGYIFSIDKQPNGWVSNYFTLGSNNSLIKFSYIYPKESNIVNEQKLYLKNYVDSFENALYANNGKYKNFSNPKTFVDYFIVNEISRNVDGYRLSAYFNKDRNGKLNAGPVWDYDLAFRNANYCNGSNVSGWAFQFNNVCPQDFFAMPFWWSNLLQDTSFKSLLRCRYFDKRTTTISTIRINNIIDSISNYLQEAQMRHFTQWPILGQYVWPNATPIPISYSEEITTLKNWLQQRMQWLDGNIPNEGTCYTATNDSKNLDITLIQNPLNDAIKLKIRSKQKTNLIVVVYNTDGSKMFEYEIPVQEGEQINTEKFTFLSQTIKIIQVLENGKKIINFKGL